MARMKVKSTAMKSAMATLQKKDEPLVNSKNYVSSMLRYLNWHNVNTDVGVMRKWVTKYLTENNRKKEARILTPATDLELRQLALLLRLRMRGDYLSTSDDSKIESMISALVVKYDVKEKRVTQKQAGVISPMERAKANISKHIGIIEGNIDDYLTSGEPFSVKNYIANNNLTPMAVKAIANHFAVLRDELAELLTGADKDLVEGYSHLRRMEQKRFFAFVNAIVVDCDAQSPKKKERKVRTKKVKPAASLVTGLRFKDKDDSLNLVSEKPENIIGATECLLYDTEKRQLIHLVSDSKFTVNGTTIKNIDLGKSSRKTLRKPEAVLTHKPTKKTASTWFSLIKTKAQGTSGRTNENIIILGVYK